MFSRTIPAILAVLVLYSCAGNMSDTSSSSSFTTSSSSSVPAITGSWSPVGPHDITGGMVKSPSVAVGSDGYIYLAVADSNYDHRLCVYKYSNNTWQMHTANMSGSNASHITFKKNPVNNSLTIAYNDQLSGDLGKAMVKYNTGAVWFVIGDSNFSAGMPAQADLAFDTNGLPYLAYSDYGNDQKLTVMRYSDIDIEWFSVGTAGFTPDVVPQLDFAIDASNTLFVGAKLYTNGPGYGIPLVYYYSNSAWNSLGGDISGGEGSWQTSMSMISNTLYMAYATGGTPSVVKVKRFNGTSWEQLGTGDLGYSYNALTMGTYKGSPAVFFEYLTELYAYVYDNGTWKAIGQNPVWICGYQSYINFSVTTDSAGLPILAFVNRNITDKPDRATVLRFSE